jgi:hypothetical protein
MSSGNTDDFLAFLSYFFNVIDQLSVSDGAKWQIMKSLTLLLQMLPPSGQNSSPSICQHLLDVKES